MRAETLIRDQASRGRYHFSTDEVARALDGSTAAARAALRRLKAKGLVASPHRGFHVIVPPEYRRLGCLPPEQFIPQLMDALGIPYYAGLLSAARYHGAAHQQPQLFQVVVPRNRPMVHCGRVSVSFVARRNAAEIPTVRVNTPRGYLAVSTPEATAFDLVGYPDHAGGLGNVATVLAELAESLRSDRLSAVAPLSPLPWSQRLGFLLDLVGASALTEDLSAHVSAAATETVPLSPGQGRKGAERDPRWKLAVNVQLETDL